jgi:ligand-binding sensor domain-containing protein
MMEKDRVLSRIALLTLVICLSIGPSSFSQPKDLKFDRLTGEQGLPALTVSGVLQDKQGFLWIATEGDGLLRFDGYYYRSFKASPDEGSLSNNALLCLYEDSEGTLWVGTFDGLNKFVKENETFIVYRHNPAANSISDNIVHCIFEDKQGVLWIGTGSGGLNRFDGDKCLKKVR